MRDIIARKNALSSTINQIYTMLEKSDNSEVLKNRIRSLEEDINNDLYTVVVVGEFKRGKSTFVNALIGEELMVSDALPETATLQAIISSDEKKAQVIYEDGTIENGEATKEFLKKFSAKSESPKKEVKYIKIGYPGTFLKKNVVLVDTPGVMDINEQRARVTYDFVPKANAVLFVLDSMSPLKKTEKEFIQDHLFKQGINNVIFILNKMDLFDDEEENLEEYMETIKNRIKGAFPEGDNSLKEINIIPVSSYNAIEGYKRNDEKLIEQSNIENVKEMLTKLLFSGDLEVAKVDAYKIRLENIVSEWKNSSERQLALLSQDRSQLQNKAKEINSLKDSREDRMNLIRGYVSSEEDTIKYMIDKSLDVLKKRIERDVDYQIDRYRGDEFDQFVSKDIPHLIIQMCEGWLSSRFSGVERAMFQLEDKLGEGLSQFFNKKVFVSSDSEEIYINNTMKMEANELTTSANLKAGLTVGGGAATLALLGVGVMSPVISMAVFPYVRSTMMKNALAKSKAEVLPTIHDEIDAFMINFKQQVYDCLDSRMRSVMLSVSQNYDKAVNDYEKSINKILSKLEKENNYLENSRAIRQKECENLGKVLIAVKGM